MPGTIFLAKVPFIVFIIYTITYKGLVWRLVTPNRNAYNNSSTNKDSFNYQLLCCMIEPFLFFFLLNCLILFSRTSILPLTFSISMERLNVWFKFHAASPMRAEAIIPIIILSIKTPASQLSALNLLFDPYCR